MRLLILVGALITPGLIRVVALIWWFPARHSRLPRRFGFCGGAASTIRFSISLLTDFFKRFSAYAIDRIPASKQLPTPHGQIDIRRIDLQTVATSAYLFGRQERRARAAKRIQDNVVAARAIFYGVCDHSCWFDGRVGAQVVHTPGAKRVCAGVFPHIRAVATVTAKLNVIEMNRIGDPKHADQLMFAAIKTALSGVGFDPDDDIEN